MKYEESIIIVCGLRKNVQANGTRLSKDDCSTGDHTIIFNQQIIQINRSLSTIDQNISMIMPPLFPHRPLAAFYPSNYLSDQLFLSVILSLCCFIPFCFIHLSLSEVFLVFLESYCAFQGVEEQKVLDKWDGWMVFIGQRSSRSIFDTIANAVQVSL